MTRTTVPIRQSEANSTWQQQSDILVYFQTQLESLTVETVVYDTVSNMLFDNPLNMLRHTGFRQTQQKWHGLGS